MTTSATRTTVVAKIPGLTGGDYTLKVRRSVMELNEARTPYGRIELVVALPDSAVLAQITPYTSLRITGTITHSWVTPVRASQTRTFNFLLHERTIDHGAATLTLVGQTDEAMLIDRINVSSTLARTYGLSLKAAVDYAMTQIGATLEAGAVDATLTSKTLDPVFTNLLTNPSAETNATGWVTSTTNAALTRQTTVAKFGTACLRSRATATTAGVGAFWGSSLNAPYAFTVVEGEKYTFSYWAYTTLSGKRAEARIRWGNASAQVGSDSVGDAVTLSPSTWTRVTVTGTVPPGAINGTPWSQVNSISTSFTSGQDVFFDGFLFVATNKDLDYFDGSTLNGRDNQIYTVAWTGTANASTSTVTNLANTDATIWQPGQSLDDWLTPMLEASNRRLFCDEQRKWRLVDSAYNIDGTISVSSGFNAKAGKDIMSRQKTELGIPVWSDHVIVHYSWKDALGVSQEMWDSAYSGTIKGYVVEINTPWPGPGAAAGILARAAGRGRTQDVTALSDYTATPGMAIVTTLPGTPIQSGVLSSVSWRWDKTADDMVVTSRGLTDTPTNAWIFAVGAWSVATGSWAGATGTN